MIRLSGRVIAPVRTQERTPETLFSATMAKVAGAPTWQEPSRPSAVRKVGAPPTSSVKARVAVAPSGSWARTVKAAPAPVGIPVGGAVGRERQPLGPRAADERPGQGIAVGIAAGEEDGDRVPRDKGGRQEPRRGDGGRTIDGEHDLAAAPFAWAMTP
jgi:hypothetical protein